MAIAGVIVGKGNEMEIAGVIVGKGNGMEIDRFLLKAIE